MPSSSNDPLDRVLHAFEVDADGLAGPDQTRAIMGRLGYMRAAPGVAARRRRRRRILGRAATAFLVVGAAFIAVRVHGIVGETRRPIGPTLEEAFRDELGRQRGIFDGAARTIRNLVPLAAPLEQDPDRTPSPWDDPRLLEDLERSGIGPFRWL